MQGDCLGALMFIYYLAECLRNEDQNTVNREAILVKPKYADDTTYATKEKETSNSIKKEITTIQTIHDITINATKTEVYTMPKPDTSG